MPKLPVQPSSPPPAYVKIVNIKTGQVTISKAKARPAVGSRSSGSGGGESSGAGGMGSGGAGGMGSGTGEAVTIMSKQVLEL